MVDSPPRSRYAPPFVIFRVLFFARSCTLQDSNEVKPHAYPIFSTSPEVIGATRDFVIARSASPLYLKRRPRRLCRIGDTARQLIYRIRYRIPALGRWVGRRGRRTAYGRCLAKTTTVLRHDHTAAAQI